RSSATAIYPARFMLVAAMNPCPCGFFTDPQRTCRCTPQRVRQYRSRISGPLMDRIDIHVEVPSLRYNDLENSGGGESSADIKKRIDKARKIQKERFAKGVPNNARMAARDIRRYCAMERGGSELVEMAMDTLGLSARGYTKILKVARTIADLEGEPVIQSHHVSEAIQYRTLDRSVI
ncbi:MAG: ATP-binding protein, partial [Syntrophales bacterium]|nr:ATP-binding protein [Syntrophales bacterium]